MNVPFSYAEVRAAQIAARRRACLQGQVPGLISFVSTVWNTPVPFLTALAETVFAQDGGADFEWLILDNGTADPATRAALDDIAKNPIVRFHRVETNLGIVGGMRFCLEKATARYILPLDSDDLLTPDCVVLMTEAILRNGSPGVLYSDEEMLDGDRHFQPYFKSDFDPVLFVNSAYIAHLCAIDRVRALELGCYTDPGAEGSHDWDSFMRFFLAGDTPVHVPHLVYSWRVHQQSTSVNVGSKPFVYSSQQCVLQKFVNAQRRPDDFELVGNPFFPGAPDWWIRRKVVPEIAVASIVLPGGGSPSIRVPPGTRHVIAKLAAGAGVRELHDVVAACDPATRFVHFLADDAEIEGEEWIRDAVGLFELFPDTVMVGGMVHDGHRVTSASRLAGFGRGFDSPDAGRGLGDSGYIGGQMWKQRTAGAVSIAHCVVDRAFLLQALSETEASRSSLPALALWLGVVARRNGRRVVYSTHFRCKSAAVPEDEIDAVEMFALLSASRAHVPETELYSRHLGLSLATAYVPQTPGERRAQAFAPDGARPAYADWLEGEIRFRSFRYTVAGPGPTLGVMTTVYPGSNWRLLEDLHRSLATQTRPFDQWVIVASGQLGEPLTAVLDALRADPRIVVHLHGPELTITPSMHLQLSLMTTDYTLPVDGDDLLTPDALQIVASVLSRSPEIDLLYSDEDQLIEGEPRHPYCRPDFDPVLNDETSYIWHLAAIRRSRALALDLYSDEAATWCHDWDTAQKIAATGGMIRHVPEVLYHWRQHPKSLSNSGTGSNKQLDSVRHVLEQRIARSNASQTFVVAEFPVSRGGPVAEYYIARRPEDCPALTAIRTSRDDAARGGHVRFTVAGGAPSPGDEQHADFGAALAVALEKQTQAVMVLAEGVEIDSWDVIQGEVGRLFALYGDVVGVGGRLLGEGGIVVESCFVTLANGTLGAVQTGLPDWNGGPYAMGLKTQSVAVLSPHLAVFRSGFLAGRPELLTCRDSVELVMRAGRITETCGGRLVYSPLVRGTVGQSCEWPPYWPGRAAKRLLGTAGFSMARLLHR